MGKVRLWRKATAPMLPLVAESVRFAARVAVLMTD